MSPLVINPDGSGVTLLLDFAGEVRTRLDDGRSVWVDIFETRAGWTWSADIQDADAAQGKGLPSREAAIAAAEAWLFAVLVPPAAKR